MRLRIEHLTTKDGNELKGFWIVNSAGKKMAVGATGRFITPLRKCYRNDQCFMMAISRLFASDSGCEHNWIDSSYANETCTNCFLERGKRFDVYSESGSLTLPYALIGLAAYMVYWMISHGVFQALTALQGVR